jgi:hypothetical protein
MLEASIALDEHGDRELGEAIADHRATVARRSRDTGERDRTRELKRTPGWAWLRPFQRLDEYERAMQELEELGRDREKELV